MNDQQAYQRLAQSMKALADIPDALIDNLYGICKPVHYQKGQPFVLAGDVPNVVGFNLNGVFRLYYVDESGNELTKGFATTGKFVISYSALAQQRPSDFYIEALVDTDILQFDYAAWMQMVASDMRWYPFLFKLLEAVYIMKELREKSFLVDDAMSRYLAFKAAYHGLEAQIRQYHIASYIGITPEALSRIRKTLRSN